MALIKSNVNRLKQTLVTTITLEDYLKDNVVGKVPEKNIRLEALDTYNVQTAIVCPFHDDNKPSMTIFHRKQDWYCFGSCRTGGDLINLHMHASATLLGKELSYLEALTTLAKMYHIPHDALFYEDKVIVGNMIKMEDITKFYKEEIPVALPDKKHYGLVLQALEQELVRMKGQDTGLWAHWVSELDYIMSLGLKGDELSRELEDLKSEMNRQKVPYLTR